MRPASAGRDADARRSLGMPGSRRKNLDTAATCVYQPIAWLSAVGAKRRNRESLYWKLNVRYQLRRARRMASQLAACPCDLSNCGSGNDTLLRPRDIHETRKRRDRPLKGSDWVGSDYLFSSYYPHRPHGRNFGR